MIAFWVTIVCFIGFLFCSYFDGKDKQITFSDVLYSAIWSIIPVINLVALIFALFYIADKNDFVIIGKKK